MDHIPPKDDAPQSKISRFRSSGAQTKARNLYCITLFKIWCFDVLPQALFDANNPNTLSDALNKRSEQKEQVLRTANR